MVAKSIEFRSSILVKSAGGRGGKRGRRASKFYEADALSPDSQITAGLVVPVYSNKAEFLYMKSFLLFDRGGIAIESIRVGQEYHLFNRQGNGIILFSIRVFHLIIHSGPPSEFYEKFDHISFRDSLQVGLVPELLIMRLLRILACDDHSSSRYHSYSI